MLVRMTLALMVRSAVAAAVLSVPLVIRADEAVVPIGLQMDLLAKIAAYDNNLAKRAGSEVLALIVTRPGDGESARASTQAQAALTAKETLGGLPLRAEVVTYGGAPALAAITRSKQAAIVYLAPGFNDGEVEAIAAALSSVEVLTATAVPRFVSKGIVLGFDLVASKPKLLFGMSQATRQGVSMNANVLALMTVYH